MTEQSILVERRDGYRVVTLNRPERRNAFNEAMLLALRQAIDEAEGDVNCRALMITGAAVSARGKISTTGWPSRAKPSCSAPRRRRTTIRWCASCAPFRFPWSPR